MSTLQPLGRTTDTAWLDTFEPPPLPFGVVVGVVVAGADVVGVVVAGADVVGVVVAGADVVGVVGVVEVVVTVSPPGLWCMSFGNETPTAMATTRNTATTATVPVVPRRCRGPGPWPGGGG